MTTVHAFLSDLENADYDAVLLAAQELESLGSQKELSVIQDQLQDVVDAINELNAHREAMTARKEIFWNALKALSKSNTPVEIQLLHQCVQTRYNEISDMIFEMRPNELLSEKYKLTRKLSEMKRLGNLGKLVREELGNAN